MLPTQNDIDKLYPFLRDFLRNTDGYRSDQETRLCWLGDICQKNPVEFHKTIQDFFFIPGHGLRESVCLRVDVRDFWGFIK